MNRFKRDSSWQMIKPGLYLDPAGYAHIFPDEVIAQLQREHPEAQFEYTRADYDLIVNQVIESLREVSPGIRVEIVRHEREPNA